MAALSHRADVKTAAETLAAVEQAVLDKQETARGHLGASQIGRSCEREIWFSWHWALPKAWGSRMLRLFARGQREEEVMAALLRGAGLMVETHDEHGRQPGFSLIGGHFCGSRDGVVSGLQEAPATPHLWECKTFNAKTYAALVRDGVKVAKPEHWLQMQVYMGAFGLTRALYTAVCKDDDQLHFERVDFDQAAFDGALARARRIIEAQTPPAGVSDSPSWYECKFCDFHGLCHVKRIPAVNCRTCAHATPAMDGLGSWTCARNQGEAIPLHFQREGCPEHVYMPSLLRTWATAVDADEQAGWIEYERLDGGPAFRQGPGFEGSRAMAQRGGV